MNHSYRVDKVLGNSDRLMRMQDSALKLGDPHAAFTVRCGGIHVSMKAWYSYDTSRADRGLGSALQHHAKFANAAHQRRVSHSSSKHECRDIEPGRQRKRQRERRTRQGKHWWCSQLKPRQLLGDADSCAVRSCAGSQPHSSCFAWKSAPVAYACCPHSC